MAPMLDHRSPTCQDNGPASAVAELFSSSTLARERLPRGVQGIAFRASATVQYWPKNPDSLGLDHAAESK